MVVCAVRFSMFVLTRSYPERLDIQFLVFDAALGSILAILGVSEHVTTRAQSKASVQLLLQHTRYQSLFQVARLHIIPGKTCCCQLVFVALNQALGLHIRR